jgi:copper ion binding protein
MKKLLSICLFALLSLTGRAATTDTLTVRVKAMRCEECAHKVKTALRRNPGVGTVKFNIERRTATIAYDSQLTTPDSICRSIDVTHRYKASPYSSTEVIRRGYGQRIDDMHCQRCADRIVARLSKLDGIDSLAPHIDKHYVFIRYDANRTCRDSIRTVLNGMGFTPVNYYTGDKVAFAYYNIPVGQATQETIDNVLTIDGVDDVNVNTRRGALAVTFFCEEIPADKLLEEIHKMGIDATQPEPHVCKEEKAL